MVAKYDVITMGSGLVDAFVHPNWAESKGEISFPVGSKLLLDRIDFSIGGGGANTATCFSKLGLRVGFLGKTGKGYNAQIIRRELKKNKIDFLGKAGEKHTGYSIILGTTKGNRTILSFKGESDNLKFSEIDFRKLKAKWIYFTSVGGESFKSQQRVAKYAEKQGIQVAYNPSNYHTKLGAKHLAPILKHTSLLSLNKEEAKMLIPRGNLFKGLSKLGPKIICVTDGPREGGVYDGNFLYRYWPNKVKIVDVTGAGDAFGSSFITGLIKNDSVERALKVAMANSESLIQLKGAHHGLLNWPGVLRAERNRKFKIKKEEL